MGATTVRSPKWALQLGKGIPKYPMSTDRGGPGAQGRWHSVEGRR